MSRNTRLLLLHGEEDRIVPIANSARLLLFLNSLPCCKLSALAQETPSLDHEPCGCDKRDHPVATRVELHTLANLGHCPHEESVNAFVATVASFVEKNPFN
jgi:pimeloyl-ACP methyl ester carboxylesterase